MSDERIEGGSEESLRPWRRASAVIALAEQAGVLAVFLLVYFADESDRGFAYAIAGALLVLEAAAWAIAREALRRIPSVHPPDIYASRTLGRNDRRLVLSGLVSLPIVLVLVSAASPAMFEDEPVVAAVVLFVAALPGYLALYRVWRHNSWLAVSWLPATPRGRMAGPNAH